MNTTVKPFLLICIFSLSIACGGNGPKVDDIKASPRYEGADLYMNLSANLDLGNVSLPSVSLPILIPRGLEQIGSVNMTTVLGGGNLLEVDLNVSSIANVQGEVATLPNGDTLPLIADNMTIVIPIEDKVRIYITLNDGQAALGVTVNFKGLDGMGRNVGRASIFPNFFINEIVGSAGFYFSKESGQNGIGLFADITPVLDPVMFLDLGFRPDIQAHSELNYNSISPSSSKERRINREMYYLDRRRAKLAL